VFASQTYPRPKTLKLFSVSHIEAESVFDTACRQNDTDGVMYLFVRYGHLIRHGVAVPPSPTGEGFLVANVSKGF